MEAVTVEGVPPLPLVTGGQINPQHQPGPHHPGLADGLGHSLDGGVTVSDVLHQAGTTGRQVALVFAWL